jgi:hypothetical protein
MVFNSVPYGRSSYVQGNMLARTVILCHIHNAYWGFPWLRNSGKWCEWRPAFWSQVVFNYVPYGVQWTFNPFNCLYAVLGCLESFLCASMKSERQKQIALVVTSKSIQKCSKSVPNSVQKLINLFRNVIFVIYTPNLVRVDLLHLSAALILKWLHKFRKISTHFEKWPPFWN